ncbi:hypothetical protein [Vreelandella neptunia]|uniref:Uncharacterized protein n=1 Tax=Vreelandella neptunia TaxID=115551 RepID=A0ABS9SC39_9GAMM|nr:hypothetical protein [Halomonas neptunia]MCH4813659.1 hypothetical protein [Halomonas neptunia]
MSENSAKSIRNGVIATVVGGVILMLIPSVRGYVSSFFSWLWSGITSLWSALWVEHLVFGWTIVLITVMALIGLVTVLLFLREILGKKDFHSYTEDVIHGAVWRWRWTYNNISGLWCFCPRCEATLVYDDSTCRNYLANTSRTDFICENCNNSVIASINGGNKSYALGAIEREIDRKIRTKEFEKH